VVRVRLVNCYFVAEDDGLTLIDTSLAGAAGALVEAARKLGGKIQRVALTHSHVDHAGSYTKLRGVLASAEFAVGERESELLAGEVRARPGEPRGRLVKPLFQRSPVKPDRLLNPGDRVGSLEVVAAPGHTPGQLAFFDHRDRTLICGDAYAALGGVFVTTEAVLRFPWLSLLGTWDQATAVETARRLRDLEPTALACGHGPVVRHPLPGMDRALARAA